MRKSMQIDRFLGRYVMRYRKLARSGVTGAEGAEDAPGLECCIYYIAVRLGLICGLCHLYRTASNGALTGDSGVVYKCTTRAKRVVNNIMQIHPNHDLRRT